MSKPKNVLPVPPRAPGPAFITSDREWSLKELSDKYGDDICKSYVVAHDYHGALVNRKLNKGDILYLVCASVQGRVVVRCRIAPGVERLYSMNNEMGLGKFQRDTGGGHFVSESDRFVCDVIRSAKDPITIRFTPSYGGGIQSPTFEFLTRYEDVTILANAIVKDKFNTDLVYLPVCAHDIKLLEITGIQKKGQAAWEVWKKKVNTDSSAVEYDLQYSSTDVGVFDTSVVDHRNITCDTPLKCYSELQTLVSELTDECTKYAEPPDIYERPEFDDGIYNVPTEPEDDKLHDYEEPVNIDKREGDKLNAELKEMLNRKKTKQNEKGEETVSQAPKLPERTTSTKKPVPQPKEQNDSIYGNMIPRGQAKPVARTISQTSESNGKETSNPKDVCQSFVVPASADDVSKLSITELGHCLTLLKMDKYVKDFEANVVDGAILQELGAAVFMETFGMTKIEAVRLEKFATEAHIPRR